MDLNHDNYSIDKDVCREVYIILNKLDLYNRLPEELRAYIEKNQNMEYKFDFNEKAPLFYQISSNETKSFLTYVFIKYINTNKADMEYCKNTVIEIMKNEVSESI